MTTTTRPQHLLRFDRTDLSASYVLIGLIALGTTLATVVWPLVDWLRGTPLSWLVSTTADVDAGPGLGVTVGTAARWSGDVVVTLADASATARVVTLVPGLILCLAVVLVAVQLVPLLRSIESGEPFVAASVRRLRVIALIVMITPALLLVAHALAGVVVSTEALTGAPFALDLTFSGVFVGLAAGLMIAAIAQAFTRGAQLRADTDGLV